MRQWRHQLMRFFRADPVEHFVEHLRIKYRLFGLHYTHTVGFLHTRKLEKQRKNSGTLAAPEFSVWCGRWDLNPHTFQLLLQKSAPWNISWSICRKSGYFSLFIAASYSLGFTAISAVKTSSMTGQISSGIRPAMALKNGESPYSLMRSSGAAAKEYDGGDGVTAPSVFPYSWSRIV